MENIIKLIQTIKGNIEKYKNNLINNERFTRYILIDPVLNLLGYDLLNPEIVIPEYVIENNQRADYVIFKKEPKLPFIIIEAKSLNISLKNNKQIGSYIGSSIARYAIFTDGNKWKLYDFYKHPEKASNDRVVLEINMFEDAENIILIKLLCLSKENLFSENPIFVNKNDEHKNEIKNAPIISQAVIEEKSKIKKGRQGFDHLEDYVIPVIKLINNGESHTGAFKKVAENLKVSIPTVSDRCARGLKIDVPTFVELVKNNKIKSFLEEAFPFQADIINKEL